MTPDTATNDDDDAPFTLARPTQRDRHIKAKFDSQPNRRQGVLFTGADCLAGQQDLPFDLSAD